MMLKRIVFMVAMFLAGVFIMEARAQRGEWGTPAPSPEGPTQARAKYCSLGHEARPWTSVGFELRLTSCRYAYWQPAAATP